MKNKEIKDSFMVKITQSIMPCSCKSEFQDKTYGKSNRVFNPMVKDRRVIGYRCTVCKKEVKK